MKNLILLTTFCLSLVFISNSQSSEGHIQYDVAINMDPNDPSAEMMATMMKGSTMDLFFQDQNSRSEIQLGKMMKMVVVVESKTGNMLTLMSGMIGKKAILSNVNEEELKKSQDPEFVVNLTNETKDVLGYACKKAILTSSEGISMNAWYTDDFTVYKKGINFLQEQIPGAPLEFDMNINGLGMIVIARKIDKFLEKSTKIFELTVPDGYEMTTIEELGKMSGQ